MRLDEFELVVGQGFGFHTQMGVGLEWAAGFQTYGLGIMMIFDRE
jgi:hypothetical protein